MAKIVEVISAEKKDGKVMVYAKNDAGIIVFKEVSETDPIADMLFAEASKFKAKQSSNVQVNQTSSKTSIKPVSEDHYCPDGKTLYDVRNLVISSVDRTDPTGEYDISYYENYINKNVIILDELIKEVKEKCALIKNTVLSGNVNSSLNSLYRVRNKNQNKNVMEEYRSSLYSGLPANGYYVSHKYANFIINDIVGVVREYSNVINFMNKMYSLFQEYSHRQDPDSSILWDIFNLAKGACSMLGVHCLSEEEMCKIVSNPFDDNSIYTFESFVVSDNSLSQDVIIESLPYSVTIPLMNVSSVGKDEALLPGNISYNQSYYDKKVDNVR